jgi:hypothetical protein
MERPRRAGAHGHHQGISRIIGFVNPDLFTLFGLPQEIPGRPAAIPGDRAGL